MEDDGNQQNANDFQYQVIVNSDTKYSLVKGDDSFERGVYQKDVLRSNIQLPKAQFPSNIKSNGQTPIKHKWNQQTNQNDDSKQIICSQDISEEKYDEISASIRQVKRQHQYNNKISIIKVSNEQIKKSFSGNKKLLKDIFKIAGMQDEIDKCNQLTMEELISFYANAVDDQRSLQVHSLVHHYQHQKYEQLLSNNALPEVQQHNHTQNHFIRDSEESKLSISYRSLNQQSQRREKVDINQLYIHQNGRLNEGLERSRSRSEGWRKGDKRREEL